MVGNSLMLVKVYSLIIGSVFERFLLVWNNRIKSIVSMLFMERSFNKYWGIFCMSNSCVFIFEKFNDVIL